MDNSGERRSADRAGQQPFPSVRPGHAITRIVSRTEEARGSSPLTSTPTDHQVRASPNHHRRRSRTGEASCPPLQYELHQRLAGERLDGGVVAEEVQLPALLVVVA
jgi:hypothetical protein